MKKISTLLLLAMLISILVGCAPAVQAPEEAPEETEKQLRVGVVFSTTIKDEGYAQAAHGALMELKDQYNLDVSFQESVTDAAVKDVLRNYASEGYDLVIAHQLYFTDAVNEVAAEFPDVTFAVSGGFRADHPNVVAVDATNWEATYLAGTLAGLMTETNQLGIITVSESPIAKRMVNAFRGAAEAQNPDVQVKHVFTGSFDDVVKGKEMATALIKDGADIVYTNCGAGNMGAIEAAAEGGVYAIGSSVDLSSKAPDTVLTSAVLSPAEYIKIIINGYINGDLEWGKYYPMGVGEGIEGLAPYHNFENKIPQDVKEKVEQVKKDLADGKIPVPSDQ
ncbi:MAG: BMP family protein [Anaerolineaceae bacterium]|nr:BMP family protein [Anaerolineaceae bacterium]